MPLIMPVLVSARVWWYRDSSLGVQLLFCGAC